MDPAFADVALHMVLPIVPVPPIFSCPRILYRIHTRCYSVQIQEAHDARSSRPPKLSSRGGRPRHLISTLNPAFLVPSDCLDLSRRKTMKVCFPTSRPGSNEQASISYERYKTPSQYSKISPFPTNCIGFLHYHRDRAPGPLEGSGLACFVPSTRPQYNGRRVVHMRITKIVTPLSCTVKGEKAKQSKPEEGELLTHFRYTRAPEPWAYDIDAKDTAVAVALRILWGNSGIL
ncbi:hypothetical protein K438DRAFT_1938911 [Mycena galopus ATCC 62051]|nr:hypothetical protein K438DRAFT_1938911 [Mycena galopus ATCC 62051]